MISADNLKATTVKIFGDVLPKKFDFERVAKELNEWEERLNIKLSDYGFVKFMFDLYGIKALYTTMGASSITIEKYARTAERMRNDMPAMLLNCSKYVQRLFNLITDTAVCFKQLEGMSFPYVLYVLFAGSGKADMVKKYEPDFVEQYLRYPSLLEKLPQQFRFQGEETC